MAIYLRVLENVWRQRTQWELHQFQGAADPHSMLKKLRPFWDLAPGLMAWALTSIWVSLRAPGQPQPHGLHARVTQEMGRQAGSSPGWSGSSAVRIWPWVTGPFKDTAVQLQIPRAWSWEGQDGAWAGREQAGAQGERDGRDVAAR